MLDRMKWRQLTTHKRTLTYLYCSNNWGRQTRSTAKRLRRRVREFRADSCGSYVQRLLLLQCESSWIVTTGQIKAIEKLRTRHALCDNTPLLPSETIYKVIRQAPQTTPTPSTHVCIHSQVKIHGPTCVGHVLNGLAESPEGHGPKGSHDSAPDFRPERRTSAQVRHDAGCRDPSSSGCDPCGRWWCRQLVRSRCL